MERQSNHNHAIDTSIRWQDVLRLERGIKLFSQIGVIAEDIVDIAGGNHAAIDGRAILRVETGLQGAHHDLMVGVVGDGEVQHGKGLIRASSGLTGTRRTLPILPSARRWWEKYSEVRQKTIAAMTAAMASAIRNGFFRRVLRRRGG